MLVVMDMLLRVAVELTEAVSLIALTSGAFPSILRSSSRNLRKKMSIRVRIVVRVSLTCRLPLQLADHGLWGWGSSGSGASGGGHAAAELHLLVGLRHERGNAGALQGRDGVRRGWC